MFFKSSWKKGDDDVCLICFNFFITCLICFFGFNLLFAFTFYYVATLVLVLVIFSIID